MKPSKNELKIVEDIILHRKIYEISVMIRLAKNVNGDYLLDNYSAKKLTESLIKCIKTFNMNDHNTEDFDNKVNDSLDIFFPYETK